MTADLDTVLGHVGDLQRAVAPQRAVLMAVTGIDGCGKGYVTARIVNALQAKGIRAVAVNIDGWLNLPDKRFDPSRPADHFYQHAIRFEEMFDRLILPLRDGRSIRLEMDYTDETASAYRRQVYAFDAVDVIALEGIYLLKRAFQDRYDLSLWIDCTFDTALERAVARSQEGLPPEETVRAYRTIYFPAQQIHFERDEPKAAATWILNNDARLGPLAVA